MFWDFCILNSSGINVYYMNGTWLCPPPSVGRLYIYIYICIDSFPSFQLEPTRLKTCILKHCTGTQDKSTDTSLICDWPEYLKPIQA